MTKTTFNVFHRTWWQAPGVPGAGPRQYLHIGVETEEQARAICREWNATHDPGELSDKAEYEAA